MERGKKAECLVLDKGLKMIFIYTRRGHCDPDSLMPRVSEQEKEQKRGILFSTATKPSPLWASSISEAHTNLVRTDVVYNLRICTT